MAAENTVIIDVDLHAQDAITQATRIGGSLKSLIESNKALRAEGKQTGAMYQTNAQAIQQLQREQKSYITLANAERGSNVQLRAQLSLLTQQYDAMASAERDGTTAGRGLELQIKSIRDELLRTESATGRFQRNVGNYASGLGGTLQQFASSSIGNTGFGSFIPQSAAIGGAYSAVAKAVGFATAAIKAQDEAVQLQNIHNAKAIELTDAEAVAQQATADAIAARTAAETALAEEQTARMALQTELSALEGVYLEEQEAEAAILTQLAAEQAVLDAAERTRIANEQALVASTTELTATEELRVATETEVAASTAASSAASEAAAAKQTALGSSFTLAGGIIIAAVLAIGAAVSKFLFTLDSVSDGFDQFKAQAGGAFTELGRQIANAYDSGGIGGVLKKIFTDFGSITKATSEAGKEFKKFEEAFQDLQDLADINEYNNQVVQNEVANLRLRAKNRSLNYEQQQDLLNKADKLERDQFEKTKDLHSQQIAEDIKYANETGRIRGQLTTDDIAQLKSGNLQRANELLNSDKISTAAYDKLKKAFTDRVSDQQQANQALERIQNDQDKFAQQAEKKAEAAQAAAQKRADELNKIDEDRHKSELAIMQSSLTARQFEFEQINSDIDKRIRAYKKFNGDTSLLEQERQVKIGELTQKFQEEDLKSIRQYNRQAEDLRINSITDSDEKRRAQSEASDRRRIEDLDDTLLEYARRQAMGEEGITDLITSAQEVRNGLQKAYDENRLHEQQETEDKLKAARQASEQQTYQDAVDLTNHLQEEYEKRQQMNAELATSYGNVASAISDLAGKQTTLGKVALVAQKAFAIAEIIINSERAKSAVLLKYALLETQAAAIPIVGEFLIIGLEVAKAAELATITTQEVASVAVTAAQTIASVAGKAKGGLHYDSDGSGTLLSGPGSGTSDSMNARLSNGEAVINARSTTMFKPLLSEINAAGGGVRFATGGIYAGYNDINAVRSQNISAQLTSAQLLTAIRTMPAPIVLVQDINDGLSQQAKVQDNASF